MACAHAQAFEISPSLRINILFICPFFPPRRPASSVGKSKNTSLVSGVFLDLVLV